MIGNELETIYFEHNNDTGDFKLCLQRDEGTASLSISAAAMWRLHRELEEHRLAVQSVLCGPCKGVVRFMLEKVVVYKDCGAALAAIGVIAAEAEAAFPELFLIITPIALALEGLLEGICAHYDMDYIKKNVDPLVNECCKKVKLC